MASLRFAANFPGRLFIHPLVNSSSKLLHEFMIDVHFANGPVMFARSGDYYIAKFREITKGSLDRLGDEEVADILYYYRYRVVNYVHVESLFTGEFRHATVCSDNACCEEHNGTRVSIVNAKSALRWIKSISHEQYGRQVFGRNWGFPPFHFKCRCRMEGVIFEGSECWRVHKTERRRLIFNKWR